MIYLILFFGLILRLIGINQSFWLDEATSATLAKNFSFIDIISKFSPADFHPPLYYLILKFWSLPFGVHEITARLLSVLLGLLTVYITYLTARKLFLGKTANMTATMAALLLASAPLHIYYSQEARMYSLETLLVSASIYVFIFLFKKPNILHWIIFSLLIALVFLADYLPTLILLVFWLYAVIQKKNLSWWSKFILSHIPFATAFAFWAPTLARQIAAGMAVKQTMPNWWKVLGGSNVKELALLPVKFMLGRISFDNKIIYGVVVVLAFALFVYALIWAIKEYKKTLLLWLWLCVPVVITFLIGLRISVFSYFRFLFVLPAFYILTAYGLSRTKEHIFPFIFMAIIGMNITFSWMYLSQNKFHREDWRSFTQKISDDCRDKNCAVIFPASSQQEAYRYYIGGDKIVQSENLNSGADKVYLVRYVWEISDPTDSAKQKVEDLKYKKTTEHNFNGIVVWEYTHNENRN